MRYRTEDDAGLVKGKNERGEGFEWIGLRLMEMSHVPRLVDV